MRETLSEAGREVPTIAGAAAREGAVGPCAGVSETGVHTVVADKGYHSRDSVRALAEVGVQTILSEPERGRQHWRGQAAERQAVYANRRRLASSTGKKLLRRRGEYLERAGAHLYDRGGMRRVHLRGKQNIAGKTATSVNDGSRAAGSRETISSGTRYKPLPNLLRKIRSSLDLRRRLSNGGRRRKEGYAGEPFFYGKSSYPASTTNCQG
jgi:hypothetical protein